MKSYQNKNTYITRKSNRVFNKIIIVLSIILLAMTLFIIKKYNNNKIQTAKQETKIINKLAKQEVIDWIVKAEELKNEFNIVNKLEVLQGEISIRDTYTKELPIVQSRSSIVKFLNKKFEELKMEEITIETSYQYIYTYDINDLDIKPNDTNDGLIITLRRCNVHLNPIAELSTDRLIQTEKGILGNITPQETGAVMECVGVNTYNKLIKDNKLYKISLDNAKINLEDLIGKLNGFSEKGINNKIEIVIDYGFDFVDLEEVVVLENSR
jgi:hypothetical protein